MKANIEQSKFKNTHCPLCQEEIGEFVDTLSVREYGISGMCQSCQDDVFADPGDCDTPSRGEDWLPEDDMDEEPF